MTSKTVTGKLSADRNPLTEHGPAHESITAREDSHSETVIRRERERGGKKVEGGREKKKKRNIWVVELKLKPACVGLGKAILENVCECRRH